MASVIRRVLCGLALLAGGLFLVRPVAAQPSELVKETQQRLKIEAERLEGVVAEISYLGGLTVYKVRLDSGAFLRSSMANTARIDIDAYGLSQRVVVWFTPDDCLVLEQ